MRRLLVLAAVAVLCAAGAEKKKKLPDLEVLELKAHRLDGKVTIDGRVRNSGEKTLQGVTVFFDFLATGTTVITTQRTALEEETLEPGKEGTFRGELVDPVRAVECRIHMAEDKGGRDLRLAKVVKVPIE